MTAHAPRGLPSRSTSGRQVRAASSLARVDFPLPAQPATTTRSTMTKCALLMACAALIAAVGPAGAR